MNEPVSAKICVLDLRTQKKESYEVPQALDGAKQSEFNKLLKERGLYVATAKIVDSETFVKSFFEGKGYEVVRLGTTFISPEHYVFQGLLPADFVLGRKGTPDFFCIRSTSDWFFLEVKTKNDGWRYNQVRWICENPYPFKLAYVMNSGDYDEE